VLAEEPDVDPQGVASSIGENQSVRGGFRFMTAPPYQEGWDK
jgi:hypothetical protein